MRYDDRLRTVLAQPATDPHDRAVRWRQLVELLARGGESTDKPLFDEAIETIRSDASAVDEQVRVAAARAIAALPAPLALVCAFAADRLSVAAPVLAAARLTASEWAEVSQAAAPECRRFISTLRCQAVPSEAQSLAGRQTPAPATGEEDDQAVPSIGEVVARIERLRQSREHHGELQEERPAEGAPEPPRLFRWECDEAGEIDWVDGAPRGALIGRALPRADDSGRSDKRLERAFMLRMPFHEATIELAEGSVVGGRWKISGVPAFDPSTGRFAGYCGIAEREQAAAEGARKRLPRGDPDALRELAHEIKTPLNAIIGFAEIISGQYLGPADEPYRVRAQEIVAQAHLLLMAIDDLDFTARAQSHREAAVADLHEIAEQVAEELGGEGLEVRFDIAGWPSCALDPALAQRLVGRFCRIVASAAGSATAFDIGGDRRHCVINAPRPQALAGERPDLALRLVIGLARIAGGDVEIGGERIRLLLPQA